MTNRKTLGPPLGTPPPGAHTPAAAPAGGSGPKLPHSPSERQPEGQVDAQEPDPRRTRNHSAPSSTVNLSQSLVSPQRQRARSDVLPMRRSARAPATLEGWKLLCADAIARAKSTLGDASALPALASGESFVDGSEELRMYRTPGAAAARTLAVDQCIQGRDLASFSPERLNSILQGLAEGKKMMPLDVSRFYSIVNGNHRWLAAKLLGLQTLTVVIV